MEKDIDKIQKNPETEIVIRVDDFGGKRGLTIREFVKSERYTGFTKAGTRIPAEKFKQFKEAINLIDEKDFEGTSEESQKTLGYDPSSEPEEDSNKENVENLEDGKETPEEQTM
jgi:hypothetical protein